MAARTHRRALSSLSIAAAWWWLAAWDEFASRACRSVAAAASRWTSRRCSTAIRISSDRDRCLAHRPNARGAAAALLHHVVYGGRSLDRVLAEARSLERDRALVHELTFGATRHFYSLSDEVSSRLTTPLKPRDSIVFCLLVIGAYQLRHTRIPSYAAVNETVGATQQIGTTLGARPGQPDPAANRLRAERPRPVPKRPRSTIRSG